MLVAAVRKAACTWELGRTLGLNLQSANSVSQIGLWYMFQTDSM
jgi:hypothetical protein